jgi:hypothetical protein
MEQKNDISVLATVVASNISFPVLDHKFPDDGSTHWDRGSRCALPGCDREATPGKAFCSAEHCRLYQQRKR